MIIKIGDIIITSFASVSINGRIRHFGLVVEVQVIRDKLHIPNICVFSFRFNKFLWIYETEVKEILK